MNTELLKDKNILFVENDQSVIDQIEPIFKKVFNNIFISKDGEDGLKVFEKNQHIDFVVTDLQVSKLDGIDMIAKIKALKEEIPSILMSADANYESFLRADEVGIYRYLLKPLDVEELLKAMVSYLEDKT